MASSDQIYREFVRRQNRTLATYLAMQAWVANLDCIAISRNELVQFWGSLKRVEDERLNWFKEDVHEHFPHVVVLVSGKKFGSVFLARRPFPDGVFSHRITDKRRISELDQMSVRASFWDLPSESEMLKYLTAAIHGLDSSVISAQVNEIFSDIERSLERR